MATQLETLDRELAKLAAALHDAVMREDHERATVLWADVDDLLERRHRMTHPQPIMTQR